jgi:hypothetical protein
MLQFYQSSVTVCGQSKLDFVNWAAWIGPGDAQEMGRFASQDLRRQFARCPDVERQCGALAQFAAHVGKPTAELIAVGAGGPDSIHGRLKTAAEKRARPIADPSNLPLVGL